MRGHGAGQHAAIGREAEHHERQAEDGEHRHLDLLGLDLLAEVFRRAPDHQAGDEDREDDEDEHAVEARAHAADDDLAELHVDERDHAAERGEAVVHGVDRAARGRRGDDGEQGGGGDAEAHLLAFHVAAVDAERVQERVARRLARVGDDDAGAEQHRHGAEDRPALPLVADHPAEDVGQRRAEREDGDHLHEVAEGRGVLERVRGVGVEEAAAVGAEHLDRHLARDGPERDRLLGAFERRRLGIGTERLRDALPHEEQRVDGAERQQHVERAAGEVDPEGAERLGARRARSRG